MVWFIHVGVGTERVVVPPWERLVTVWIIINYGPRGVVYHSLYLIYYAYSRCHSRAIAYFNIRMYHNDRDKWGPTKYHIPRY